jgi:hypothetical protein
MISAMVFLGTLAVSAIGAARTNAEYMSKPTTYLPNGEPLYVDRRGGFHDKTGEKCSQKYYENIYGKSVLAWTTQSGRIMYDPRKDDLSNERKKDEENLERALKYGKKGYMKWNPSLKCHIPIEISSGRPCYVVKYDMVKYGGDITYAKFYSDDLKFDLFKDERIDNISRDEYYKYPEFSSFFRQLNRAK